MEALLPNATTAAAPGKGARRTGLVLSVVVALMLVMSGAMKLKGGPDLEKGFTDLGWPTSVALILGVVEITSAVLYLIPQTSVLGAILLTGYMGGAIAAHVRVQEMFIVQAAIGVVVWLGLYLRDPRVRALIPLRSKPE